MVELGGAMDKIVVIPNTAGLPPPPLRPIEGDLIAIGSLEPRKNQAFLLQVLAEANRLGYRYQLNVVGSGESRLALEALTHELGLAGQVHFLGRIDQASSLLTGHKLLVHSALIENMPITLIEALASGTPILAPPVGGIPEIVRDGVEGFHWNLSDVPGSARILIKLMNDPVLRKSMSEAGRSRFLANFESSAVLTSLARAVYG
jgi:glycosyltransferase involved in cell wall biosynthesis